MSLINKIIGKLNLSPTKEKVVRNVVWAVTGKVVTLLGSLLVGTEVHVGVFAYFATHGFDGVDRTDFCHSFLCSFYSRYMSRCDVVCFAL